jgi:hypothetical protein
MSTFALRLPESLYAHAKLLVEQDQASLNQFITVAVSDLRFDRFFGLQLEARLSSRLLDSHRYGRKIFVKNFALFVFVFIVSTLQAHAQVPMTENFVVLHTPGPQWKMRTEHAQALQAHRKIYEELARKGDILFGGSFQGEPVLGMSVFSAGVDREKLAAELRLDPSVVAGVIALEFRVWRTQLGELPDPTRKKSR